MAISSECPGCGRRVSVSDSFLGKKVRCKGCGEPFVARETASDEEGGQLLAGKPARSSSRESFPAPKKRARDFDDEDDVEDRVRRRPRSSADNASKGLIIGLSVGGGVLLIGVIVTVIILATRSDKSEPSPTAGTNLPAAPDGFPQGGLNPPPGFPQGGVNPPPGFPQINPPGGQPQERDPIQRALNGLRTNDIFSQSDAARSLEKTAVDASRQAEVVRALQAVINNRQPLIPRKEAIMALAVWGTAADGAFLMDLLNDEDGGVKEEAIRALGRRKEAGAADALAGMLSDFFMRGHASQALKDIGPGAEAAVLKQLSSPDNGVRVEACKILKKIGTPASHPRLIALARDEDQGVANAARDALPENKRPPVWGPNQTMKLNVKVVNLQAWPAIEARIKVLAEDPNPICKVHRSGDYMWVDLAPVSSKGIDFARKINFATVGAVHDRLIYLDSGQ